MEAGVLMDERLAKRLENFLDNHWPHMQTRVGRLEGQSKVIIGLTMLGLAGIVTILVKVMFP